MLGCLGVALILLAITLFIPILHVLTFPIFVITGVAFVVVAVLRATRRK
jgi:hypothetical protein